MSSPRLVVARVGELAPRATKKFIFSVNGQEIEAFLLNHDGELHAYLNRCCHIPMGLDWVENQFYTEDGEHVMCATHGACYRPESGECVSGPPYGRFLTRVPLSIEGDEIIATLPESEVASGV